MFCDRCGTQLADNAVYCASCGKQVNPAAPAPMATAPRSTIGRVEQHLRTLGICWLAYSTLRLLGGWFFASLFSRWWGWGWGGFGGPRFGFVPGILHGVGMVLMAVGVAGIMAGWGLLERQPWARMLAIVLGFVVLFNFGLGTVLGIYTLWVLLPAESEREYQRTARVV